MSGLSIIDYSEKSFAVLGDTKPYKDYLKNLGGRYNKNLKINDESECGWIFSKKRFNEVENFISQLPSIKPNPNLNTPKVSIVNITPKTFTIPNKNTNKNTNLNTNLNKTINKNTQRVSFEIFLPVIGMIVTISGDFPAIFGKVVKTETTDNITDVVYVEILHIDVNEEPNSNEESNETNTNQEEKTNETYLLVICRQKWQVYGLTSEHSVTFN